MDAPAYRDRDVIRRTAELLASDVPLREVFAQFCQVLADVLRADRAFIALREGPSLRVVHLLAHGRVEEPDDAEAGEGSYCASVARTGNSIIARDATVVPLKFGADIIGVLFLQRTSAAFEQADVELLETCSLYLAVRVHQARQEIANRALHELVENDGLTGIANRRAFDQRLTTEWQRCAAAGAQLAIVFVDVDYFKVFNDSYGHIGGDSCLQHVARALSACTKRKSDMLARYGGEEFAAILPSTNATDAIAIAERMRAAIEALHIDHDGSSLRRLSISVGIAAVDADADVDPMTVVKRADEAVYVAKSRGRNRAVGPGYESASEPARQRHATRRNLPLQLTRFLGRERELADVQRLIREARLVTLAGPGGIGKTRLSIETGRTLLESFVDGVWLVDLASVDDPAQVASAFAAALEIEATEETPPAQLVTAALKNKNALLLLDNYEHLLDACAGLIDAVLAQAGNLHVLATSRQPLGLNGERVYRVNALDLPVSGAPSTLREAEAFDGIAFFIARARESVPAFVLSDARVPTVVRICRRLDGIPLAIELAAARLRTMSLEELAEQLDTGFSVLVAGRSGAPRRQTLEALFAWSFDLLTAAEKAVFTRLAVFAGTWSLAAATAVCSGDDVPEAAVLDELGQLVDKSLVLLESHGTRNRYRFLESTREFARERLAESGESEAVRARFVGYYRALAERARAAPALQPTRLWLPPLIPEWDNFRSVLSACLIGGGDRVAGATIAVGLIPFWEAMSKSADARVWLEAALVAEGLPDPLVAQLSLGVAFFLRTGNEDPERAALLSRRALEIARSAFDEAGVCDALVSLGGSYLIQSRTADAQPLFKQALELAGRHGYRLAESDALNNLGMCADFAGDPVESRRYYEESLAIARSLGHDRRTARALHNLCALSEDAGDLDGAARYEREAVAIIERYGTPRTLLIYLADIEMLRGNLDAANRLCRDALEGLVLERSMWLVRECLLVFAQVHANAGHDHRAACLVGFMKTLDPDLAPLQPSVAALYERFIGDLEARMSTESYASATREGAVLTLDAAVAEANLPL